MWSINTPELTLRELSQSNDKSGRSCCDRRRKQRSATLPSAPHYSRPYHLQRRSVATSTPKEFRITRVSFFHTRFTVLQAPGQFFVAGHSALRELHVSKLRPHSTPCSSAADTRLDCDAASGRPNTRACGF